MSEHDRKCARCNKQLTDEMWSAPVSGTGNGEWCLPCYTYNTGLDRNGRYVAEELSEHVLKAAIRRLEQRKRSEEFDRKNAQAETIIQNIDALLLLVSDHAKLDRMCSDQFPTHAVTGGCARCALIVAEAEGFWRNDKNLVITVEHDAAHSTIKRTVE